MRFLKNKVEKARQSLGRIPPGELEGLEDEDVIISTPQVAVPVLALVQVPTLTPIATAVLVPVQQKAPKDEPKLSQPSRRRTSSPVTRPRSESSTQVNSSKNIVKNYGRAISAFTLSDIGLPYLQPLVRREAIKIEEFKAFISNGKENIDGISSFRNMLLASGEDSEKTVAFKKVLSEMSVVFIKYFSVNWIFSSKLRNKIAHLKCRYKMLRRVTDPVHFTYLKTSN